MNPKTLQQQPPFQIFIQSPHPQIPSRALTLPNNNPNDNNLTLHHLILSLFPSTTTTSHPPFFFTLNGRTLLDSTPLHPNTIAPLSTLTLHLRLPGGGGDGGATGAESRDCYLNMYAIKKPDKVDPNEKRLSKWLNCALSNESLRHPVVVDHLGNLFNKEALVEALLAKKVPKEFRHVKGLKDMIQVELGLIPGLDDGIGSGTQARFQCPITGLEFNGKYKFFALRTCGHVLSAKALKEVKSSSCLVCHKEFDSNDKIVINGDEDEVASLKERREEEKSARVVVIKEKKEKKRVKNGVVVDGAEVVVSRVIGMKREIEGKGVGVETGLDKVQGNGKVGNGGGLVVGNAESNGKVVKRFKGAAVAPPNANKEVYASIFTSSRKSELKETYSCRSLPLGRN